MIIRFRDNNRTLSRRRSSSSGSSSTQDFLRLGIYGFAILGFLDVLTRLYDGFSSVLAPKILECFRDSRATVTLDLLAHSPTQQQFDPRIRDSLLQIEHLTAEIVWDNLLQEGTALMELSSKKPLVALEVGMYRAHQCLQAASAGMIAHCVEPSPTNFQRAVTGVKQRASEIKGEIHLHQNAASATSGVMLNFSASGGTGDHVGEFDVWNMKVGRTTDEAIAKKLGSTVQVASIKVDDIIEDALQSDEERVFIVKVDTQGYEPSVFAGLHASVIQQQRVDYILFEYWPKGMDLLASTGEDGSDHTKACIAADLLEKLQRAGYTLYALPDTSHPQAPRAARNALKNERAPTKNARDNCEYYYELEARFPSDYKMGYWSDMLAVAPRATLIDKPATAVGQILKQQEKLASPIAPW